MRNSRMIQRSAIGIAVAFVIAALGYVAIAADSSRTDAKPTAVDAERSADIFGNEVFDIQDLAEGAEIQRRFFNRITPPGFSWLQPMFPPVVPFDATNFDDSFLDDLLGEDKNSVAIYPLSLALDPKTRETLVYNADGKLIATIPSDKISRSWPVDADPSRVTLQLNLLSAEDVEPYLYTESRVEEFIASTAKKSAKVGGPAQRSLGASEFGICNIQKLTNGNMRLTLTNGTDAAEVYAYTVLHTSTVVVVTWTNEESNVVTDTNTLWTPVSPPFNGLESAWACAASNLALTNGVGIWEDANISSNARVHFYGVANRISSDEDGLTDGAETFLYHTDSDNVDTDGDGLLDGYDIVVGFGDARYDSWAGLGIIYVENGGVRTFRGELSAGSDPLDDDSDDDGLLDGWEVQNELDPMDADGVNGPEGDLDEDGFVNGLEWELGAPANNEAWNGNELAYRLTHAYPATNARWGATNLIGMRVTVTNSWDCEDGGYHYVQNHTDDLEVPALLDCGYYINITVEGSVEGVDSNYDKVSFEAFTNTPYFESHDDITGDDEEYCLMVDEGAEKNNLIFGNTTVKLRYNTAGYRWHSGGYAEIVDATNTGPYNVVVSGDDAICVGGTTTMGASGAAGPPFTWSGGGYVSVSTNGDVTGLSPGLATVMATGSNGCSGEKEIFVLKPDIGTVAPLADRTLHPNAARKPLLLKQTLPAEWNGLMQLSLSGAVAYWTPTGGTPIASGIFTNAQLPQTIYLEGDGCGVGEASFAIVGPPGCETNTPLYVTCAEFLDSSQNPVSNLKVGKWENGFNAGPAVKDNFIDLDPDRFYIRVNDQSKKGTGKVSVNLSTDSDGADYDDDATEIELPEQPTNSGIFISTNMVMVSDDVDDDFTNPNVVADDTKNDRTHKIALGGLAKVQYPNTGTEICDKEASVPPSLKTVDVNIIVLNVGGAPVISLSAVSNTWLIAQERYAQIGIQLRYSISTANQPAGVDLSNGLDVASSSAPTWTQVAQEAKDLINALGTTNTTSDIHAFYVNTINAFGSSASRGVAIADYWFDESEENYIYNFVVASTASLFTAPHELGHLVGDNQHHSDQWNLMRSGTSAQNGVTESKRLDTNQESGMRGDNHAQ